jgi:hypothetical protein
VRADPLNPQVAVPAGDATATSHVQRAEHRRADAPPPFAGERRDHPAADDDVRRDPSV